MLLALRLRNFVNRLLARSGSTLITQALPVASEVLWLPKQFHIPAQKQPSLPLLAALLVTLPVFVQAPLVRQQPMLAVLFTFVLLAVGISKRNSWGNLLVGFSGSWLAGCLFWGWLRLHPLWHLPVEAFALPIAVAGLWGPWRIAGQFYLGALIGTACTDAAMAICGVMPLWPEVLAAEPEQARQLLAQAAALVIEPAHFSVVVIFAAAMLLTSRWLWRKGAGCRLVAACLATTLVVDGIFLGLALLIPQFSGLV